MLHISSFCFFLIAICLSLFLFPPAAYAGWGDCSAKDGSGRTGKCNSWCTGIYEPVNPSSCIVGTCCADPSSRTVPTPTITPYPTRNRLIYPGCADSTEPIIYCSKQCAGVGYQNISCSGGKINCQCNGFAEVTPIPTDTPTPKKCLYKGVYYSDGFQLRESEGQGDCEPGQTEENLVVCRAPSMFSTSTSCIQTSSPTTPPSSSTTSCSQQDSNDCKKICTNQGKTLDSCSRPNGGSKVCGCSDTNNLVCDITDESYCDLFCYPTGVAGCSIALNGRRKCQCNDSSPSGGKSSTPTPIFRSSSSAPAKVCTPGTYSRACTGKCGGCADNAGEQDVWQCNADGTKVVHVGGECSTACAPACDSSLPPDDSRGEYNVNSCNGGFTVRTCTGECGGCADNAGEELVTIFEKKNNVCTYAQPPYTQCSKTCNGACSGGVPNKEPRSSDPNAITTVNESNNSNSRSGSNSGGNNGGSSNSNGGQSNSCPASGDNCVYSDDTGVCYSGHTDGKGGFNVPGCTYSCGPVDCPTVSSNSPTKPEGKNYIECTPGDPVNSFNDIACPNGKAGTCGGHSYCVWSENGNYESDPQCETANDTCYDQSSSSNNNNNENSCKDNPTDPPDGYTWKNSCNSCNNNDDCPQNNNDQAVSPETSNWCYSGSCLMLVSNGGSSKNDNKNSSSKNKNKDKNKSKDKKSGKDVNDGKTKDDTGNRNKSNNSNEKSDRDKAQKPIDKINKQLAAEGKPTLTPLPPDNGAYEAYLSSTPTQSPTNTPTAPTPTPLPPPDEPSNWKAFCGETTNANKPYGMQLSWDGVKGAVRYAIRIDADAPSWEGDTPSPGDTVDNYVANNVFVKEAAPGGVYQWWVHSVNASGAYSALTHKMTLKCPEKSSNTTTPTQGASTVGAGQLIVLP